MARLSLPLLLLLAACGDPGSNGGRLILTDCLDCEWPPIDVEPAASTLLECGFSSISPSGVVSVTTDGCP